MILKDENKYFRVISEGGLLDVITPTYFFTDMRWNA